MSGGLVDVTGIGNAIVDVLAHADERVPRRARARQGHDGADRRARARRALCRDGPGGRGLGRLGGQHDGRHRFARRSLRRTSARCATTSWARCSRTTSARSACTSTRRPRAAAPATARCLILVTPRRAAHDEHLSRRVPRARPRRHRRSADRAQQGHVPRGLPVGPARGQGSLLEGERDRAQGGAQGLALALRSVLRRAPPRRVPRARRDHVDILFANEREICSLYERGAARRRGERGARALRAGGRHAQRARLASCCTASHVRVPAEKVARVVDTTGAGDLFAAGFLYGYTQGRSPGECARSAPSAPPRSSPISARGPRRRWPSWSAASEEIAREAAALRRLGG